MSHASFVPTESSEWWPCPLGISSPFEAMPRFMAVLRSDSAPSFPLAHYKVPSCSAVREMKAPFTGFTELEPHVCFPSVTYFFLQYNSISYMFFLSLGTNSLIKFYSIFPPISQKAISKFIPTLCCGNIMLGSKLSSFLYHFLKRISVQTEILPILNAPFSYHLSNSQHPWLPSCLLCLFTSFTTEQGGLAFTAH